MTEHIQLIGKKLGHLRRMQAYLAYSLDQVRRVVPIDSWENLTADNHETLAAFRVRFSEYQEHLGKTMRAIAIEEEHPRHCEERSDAAIQQADGSPRACGPRDDTRSRHRTSR